MEAVTFSTILILNLLVVVAAVLLNDLPCPISI